MKTFFKITVALILVLVLGNSARADYSAVRARRNKGFGCRTYKPRRVYRNMNRYYYPAPYRGYIRNTRPISTSRIQTVKRRVVNYPTTAVAKQTMYRNAHRNQYNRQAAHRTRFTR